MIDEAFPQVHKKHMQTAKIALNGCVSVILMLTIYIPALPDLDHPLCYLTAIKGE